MKYISTKERRDEIREYMQRFENVSPEDIMKQMGEMRDFLWKCMTPEGRRAFLKSRGLDASDFEEEINKEYFLRK